MAATHLPTKFGKFLGWMPFTRNELSLHFRVATKEGSWAATEDCEGGTAMRGDGWSLLMTDQCPLGHWRTSICAWWGGARKFRGWEIYPIHLFYKLGKDNTLPLEISISLPKKIRLYTHFLWAARHPIFWLWVGQVALTNMLYVHVYVWCSWCGAISRLVGVVILDVPRPSRHSLLWLCLF